MLLFGRNERMGETLHDVRILGSNDIILGKTRFFIKRKKEHGTFIKLQVDLTALFSD